MSNQDKKIEMTELGDYLSNHKYTSVFHETNYENNAPRHFIIVDKSSIGDRNDFKPTMLGALDFQNGLIIEGNGVNGVMDENIIAIAIKRLQCFQDSKYACQENAMALVRLEEAMMWLKRRTADRELRNVEETHEV